MLVESMNSTPVDLPFSILLLSNMAPKSSTTNKAHITNRKPIIESPWLSFFYQPTTNLGLAIPTPPITGSNCNSAPIITILIKPSVKP